MSHKVAKYQSVFIITNIVNCYDTLFITMRGVFYESWSDNKFDYIQWLAGRWYKVTFTMFSD